MEQTCDNCYWRIRGDQCIKKLEPKNRCEGHNYECECGSEAEYKYEDDFYCADCIMEHLDIDTYTTTHYTLDGGYLGCDDDLEEVIDRIKSRGYKIEDLEDRV